MLIKLLQLTAVSASMRHVNTTQGDRPGDTDTVVLLLVNKKSKISSVLLKRK